jgi:carboxyl-terminal processing protease
MDYAGFGRGAQTYSSTQHDVEALIAELNRQGVDGIILDLRGNKGGALRAATGLTGLFIETGPVVQIKNATGSVQIFRDSDARMMYKGPLAVLVDRYSASASEIFAGAIQDYGRGIIVGGYTFGKGSVQETYDLNDHLTREQSTFGQLVITTALYFRITGESTQLRGVKPDVVIPTSAFAAAYSERSERSAIPWEAIAAIDYQPVLNTVRVTPEVLARHRRRIANNPVFRFIRERNLLEANDNTPDQVSLQLEKRRQQANLAERARRKAGASLAQLTNEQANQNELEFIIDKALLNETARILSDAIAVNKPVEGGGRQ